MGTFCGVQGSLLGTPAGCLKGGSPGNFCWMFWPPDLIIYSFGFPSSLLLFLLAKRIINSLFPTELWPSCVIGRVMCGNECGEEEVWSEGFKGYFPSSRPAADLTHCTTYELCLDIAQATEGPSEAAWVCSAIQTLKDTKIKALVTQRTEIIFKIFDMAFQESAT